MVEDAASGLLSVTDPQGNKQLLWFTTVPGCGGGCESQYLKVGDQPFDRYGEPNDSAIACTPSAHQWQIYSSRDGEHYALGVVGSALQVFKIVPRPQWRLSCSIVLAPDNLQQSEDAHARAAADAVDAFLRTAGGLMQGAGDCGTMRTASRLWFEIERYLAQAIYRPWALFRPPAANDGREVSDNSFGDYSRIGPQLQSWSLGGLDEYHAYAAFDKRLSESSRILGDFYVRTYGWEPERGDARDECTVNAEPRSALRQIANAVPVTVATDSFRQRSYCRKCRRRRSPRTSGR